MSIRLSTLVGAALISLAASAEAAVVFSDNFDGEAQGVPVASLSNWSIPVKSVDVIGPGLFDFYPGNGNYLDMTGSPGAAQIVSNMVFGPGTYVLSFNYANNFDLSSASMSVSLGGFSATVVSNTPPNFLFYISVPITLTSSSQLIFTSLTGGAGGFAGALLDNVVVTGPDLAPVPAPAALGLMLVGLAGLVAARRR